MQRFCCPMGMLSLIVTPCLFPSCRPVVEGAIRAQAFFTLQVWRQRTVEAMKCYQSLQP